MVKKVVSIPERPDVRMWVLIHNGVIFVNKASDGGIIRIIPDRQYDTQHVAARNGESDP